MQIWHQYSVGHGRFFCAVAILPWPLAILSLFAERWVFAVSMVLFGLSAYCNYRHMCHFTKTMERWATRRQTRRGPEAL